jgi:hypothetical protein
VGARLVTRRLRALGVDVIREEFDDDHFGISYRYDRSLPWMTHQLAGG